MTTFSSHILNSVNGHHAARVEVSIFQINPQGEKHIFCKTETNDGGRILEEFDLTNDDCLCDYEMIIKTGDYFLKDDQGVV